MCLYSLKQLNGRYTESGDSRVRGKITNYQPSNSKYGRRTNSKGRSDLRSGVESRENSAPENHREKRATPRCPWRAMGRAA